MKKLEFLKKEIVEEGRAHPFVEALVSTLVQRHAEILNLLEAQAAAGTSSHALIGSTGGRAFEVRNLIALISTTQGREE